MPGIPFYSAYTFLVFFIREYWHFNKLVSSILRIPKKTNQWESTHCSIENYLLDTDDFWSTKTVSEKRKFNAKTLSAVNVQEVKVCIPFKSLRFVEL